MEQLKELIDLVSRHKVKGIEIIGDEGFRNSKLQQLYDGIHDGDFSSDAEAQVALYKNDKRGNLSYKKLKSRLQDRLINTVFFIDVNQPSYNEIQRAYYTCYKDWAAVKILLGKGARMTAIPISEGIMKKAEKFEFSELALDIARSLRLHYSYMDVNKRKYNRYNVIVKKYEKILMAELLTEEYRSNIASMLESSKHSKADISKLANDYTNILKKETQGLNSYRLNLNARTIYAYRFEVVNDYKNLIKECEESIKFFESKAYGVSKMAVFAFMFKKLVCHIQLKQFKKGEEIAKKCLVDLPEGSPNWFYTHEMYITLCLHTERFQEAYEVYEGVRKHKNFSRLYQKSAERWKLYEAYINYFIFNGEIKIDTSKKPEKFRLHKFLNELPEYSKDKRGRNIPILVIHIMFLLQQNNYSKVIDRVEAINQYAYRYLRDDDTYRSNCFIKMLIQLPAANFHKQAVVRKTEKSLEKLKSKPLEVAGQSDEIEIVPYEVLWKYVINTLDNQFH